MVKRVIYMILAYSAAIVGFSNGKMLEVKGKVYFNDKLCLEGDEIFFGKIKGEKYSFFHLKTKWGYIEGHGSVLIEYNPVRIIRYHRGVIIINCKYPEKITINVGKDINGSGKVLIYPKKNYVIFCVFKGVFTLGNMIIMEKEGIKISNTGELKMVYNIAPYCKEFFDITPSVKKSLDRDKKVDVYKYGP